MIPLPVHPRSRGEHPVPSLWFRIPHGSSPLARGTRGRQRHSSQRHRFIPARAGNTPRARARASIASVHPRSRGEHGRPEDLIKVPTGSSPLARGTRPCGLPSLIPSRFIPARAGNTGSRCKSDRDTAVHPRSRGEHAGSMRWDAVKAGSSPLARGTHRGVSRMYAVNRFIPARAGNTDGLGSPVMAAAVHPRSRGEHRFGWCVGWLVGGSSPLARGTPTLYMTT